MTYRMLGRPPLRDTLPWERISLFFADERFAPSGSRHSNYGLVYDSLIQYIERPVISSPVTGDAVINNDKFD